MKLYTATLINNYIQGNRYVSLLSIQKSPTIATEVSKVELQYWLVTNTNIIASQPEYSIHCTIEIPENKVVDSQLKGRKYAGEYQDVGTLSFSRKLDVAHLISGITEVSSEEIFKSFSKGYYGTDILNVFGDFALCNQCIGHYIPPTLLALL